MTQITTHQRMLDEIDRELRFTRQLIGRNQLDRRVRSALEAVPRHVFVPDALHDAAYDNGPLPIGEGQTISQPYIVAIMTELLDLQPDDRVLEIGTGSGYQTAILAELVQQVYSIEIVPKLAACAETRLKLLGYSNIEIRCGDGYEGWQEAAPFDAIMITAATPYIPQPLLDQLNLDRKLIAPLENAHNQELMLYKKVAENQWDSQRIIPVAFVPMTGRAQIRHPTQ